MGVQSPSEEKPEQTASRLRDCSARCHVTLPGSFVLVRDRETMRASIKKINTTLQDARTS